MPEYIDIPDFLDRNATDCLRAFGRSQPDHPAVEQGDRALSYAALDRRADEAACFLRDAGIRPGEMVTIRLRDSIDHLIVLCGLLRAGGVMFSLSMDLNPAKVAAAMASASSNILITHSSEAAPDGVQVLTEDAVCAADRGEFGPAAAFGDAPMTLLQSSGTTGAPKSILVSHRVMLQQQERSREGERWTPASRYANLSDMSFHVGRDYYFSLLHYGGTIVLLSGSGIREMVVDINRRKVSYLRILRPHLVSFLHFAEMDGTPGQLVFPHLDAMAISSSPIGNEQRLQARRLLTPNFHEYFGSNEAGSFAVALPTDQDTHPNAVGRIYKSIDVEVVDPEAQALPPGEAGLIRVRGTGVVDGYLDNQEMSGRFFKDGWHYPGDIGRINEDGYLFFLGRGDDVINRAGEKFYPIEVEQALASHPNVKEVAVFPMPSRLFGEAVAAAVVLHEPCTPYELKRHCATLLERQKVPATIRAFATLPKNAMGKVLKRKLVEIFNEPADQPPTKP